MSESALAQLASQIEFSAVAEDSDEAETYQKEDLEVFSPFDSMRFKFNDTPKEEEPAAESGNAELEDLSGPADMSLVYTPFQSPADADPQPLEPASDEEAAAVEAELPEEVEDLGPSAEEAAKAADIIEEVDGVNYINEENLNAQPEKESPQNIDTDFKNLVDSVLLDD
jgi:hypothetical protein